MPLNSIQKVKNFDRESAFYSKGLLGCSLFSLMRSGDSLDRKWEHQHHRNSVADALIDHPTGASWEARPMGSKNRSRHGLSVHCGRHRWGVAKCLEISGGRP